MSSCAHPRLPVSTRVLLCPCRGRLLYQLSLSLWRLLCLCYYAEVRLEVLKLTKHMEDGTIKARWRVKGLPFHSLLLRFYYQDKSQLYRYHTAARQPVCAHVVTVHSDAGCPQDHLLTSVSSRS